jgi:hypothetical protein
MQLAVMEITKCPALCRKMWATIQVWSGWAMSTKITSIIAMSRQYLCGYGVSSITGVMLVLFLAKLRRWEKLTASETRKMVIPRPPGGRATWLLA